jgi:hypothetical protein
MCGDTCLWLAVHQNLPPLSDPTRSAGSSSDSRQPTFAEDRLAESRRSAAHPRGQLTAPLLTFVVPGSTAPNGSNCDGQATEEEDIRLTFASPGSESTAYRSLGVVSNAMPH